MECEENLRQNLHGAIEEALYQPGADYGEDVNVIGNLRELRGPQSDQEG